MSSNGHNSNSKTKAIVHLLYYLRLPSQMAIGKVKRGKRELRDFYENHYRMQTALHAHNQSITQQQIQTKERNT